MGRAPCCDKATVRKGPWSPEEDATLKSYIEEHGPVDNWIALPQKIGLKRCGKSCRLRWLNYLRPNIRHGGFSEEEDKLICSLYINIGSRWSIIAAQLPGRTDNDIKNYWNTKLKKKLLGKQRNRENHVRKNSSQRGGTKASSENEDFSVISGTGSDWCGVPHGVFHLPPASMNQNPNPIIDQAAIRELLVELGGRFSPNQEQEPVPMNTDFLLYPNDMIPPSYNPIERSMVFASSQLSGFSSNGLLPTRYSMSKVDNVPVVIDNMLPDFSTDEGEHRDQQSLFKWPHMGNICGTHEVTNASICGSALSHRVGSSNIWEDISFSSLLADSELAAASQSLGGRRGTGDSSFEESRSVLRTLNGIL